MNQVVLGKKNHQNQMPSIHMTDFVGQKIYDIKY